MSDDEDFRKYVKNLFRDDEAEDTNADTVDTTTTKNVAHREGQTVTGPTNDDQDVRDFARELFGRNND